MNKEMSVDEIDTETGVILATRNAAERMLDFQAATDADEVPEATAFMAGLARRLGELTELRAAAVRKALLKAEAEQEAEANGGQ